MTRLIVLLALSVCPPLAMAGDTPTIGRLFHTPEERQNLDRLRDNGGAKETAALERISLDGVVKRANGKSTTWVNGVAHHESDRPQGILVGGKRSEPTTASVLLSSGKEVRLKPGQSYDVKSESLQDVIGAPRQNQELNAPVPSNLARQNP